MDYEQYEQDKKALESVSAQMQKSLNSRLGKLRFRCMKAADFDAEKASTGHSVQQVTFVNRDGEIELWLGDVKLSFGESYEGPYIENAIVLLEEQLETWASNHQLLPVEFRGETTAYYTGVPSYFVLQGHRCKSSRLWFNETTPDDVVSELELTFRTGEKRKLTIYIYKYDGTNLWLGAQEWDTSGATPTIVRNNYWTGYWTLPDISNSTLKIGFTFSTEYFYTNSNGDIAPRYWVNVCCFVNDTAATPVTVGSSNPTGLLSNFSLFNNHENVDFANNAERHFAYGLARRTEPIYPNGGE